MQELVRKLSHIQQKLNAPKSQKNKFGNYNYRSCEDILEALKPFLSAGLVVVVNDDMWSVGDRIYVKATAKITDGEHSIECNAFAREPLDKKGMDSSQITGAASSYARKYALNGLFLIDDNKDPDSRSPEDNKELKKDALSQKQRDFVLGLINNNQGLELFCFSQAYADIDVSELFNHGEKGDGQVRYKRLVRDGADEFKLLFDEINSRIESCDDLGVKEEYSGLGKIAKQYFYDQLTNDKQKYITELFK